MSGLGKASEFPALPSEEEEIDVKRSCISSIYRNGVLRHRCTQSSRKVTTLSASSVSFALSGDVALGARTKHGRERSQRRGSVGVSWKKIQLEKRCERRSRRVDLRAGIWDVV